MVHQKELQLPTPAQSANAERFDVMGDSRVDNVLDAGRQSHVIMINIDRE